MIYTVYQAILLSAMMLSVASSECFNLSGSLACGAFAGSFVSPTKDFKDVKTLDSFIKRRLGTTSDSLYVESFRYSYGCKDYNGGGQDHLQIMFCAQLIAGSADICQSKADPPLCASTCAAATKDLIAIFKSADCSASKANPVISASSINNRIRTLRVYQSVCTNTSITYETDGCVSHVGKTESTQSASISNASQGPQEGSAKSGSAQNVAAKVAPVDPPVKVNTAQNQVPSQQFARSDNTSNTDKVEQKFISSQSKVADDHDNQDIAINGQPDARPVLAVNQESPPVQLVAAKQAETPSKSLAANQVSPPAQSAAAKQEAPLIQEMASNEASSSEQNASPASEPSPSSDVENDQLSNLPAALAPNAEQVVSTNIPDTSVNEVVSDQSAESQNISSGNNSNSVDGKYMIWIIVGSSIAVLLALIVGFVIYKRRRSASDSQQNIFKGSTDSYSSYGASSNTFTSSNEGVVARPYLPDLPDEVALNVGDRVEILEVYDDGWALGDNVNTGGRGVFPLQCLEPASQSGIATSNPSRISSLYSINKYYGKSIK